MFPAPDVLLITWKYTLIVTVSHSTRCGTARRALLRQEHVRVLFDRKRLLFGEDMRAAHPLHFVGRPIHADIKLLRHEATHREQDTKGHQG